MIAVKEKQKKYYDHGMSVFIVVKQTIFGDMNLFFKFPNKDILVIMITFGLTIVLLFLIAVIN